MKRTLLLLTTVLLFSNSFAQKKEQGFDAFFKPTDGAPRYYVVTEKKDTGWFRQAWYLPERSQALEAWYKDEACTIPHGPYKSFHTTNYLQTSGYYANGLKHGTWLTYTDDGHLTDSINYDHGKKTGISLRWAANGFQTDSMNFDGKGNGVEVSWYSDGAPSSSGYWVNDTTKKGRWNYYHTNGKIKATEDYVEGKRMKTSCYDENGVLLDSALCVEKEAYFPGNERGWRTFLEKNLDAAVPVRMGAPVGTYTAIVQFIVDKDGSISNIKALTHYGYGMEEEVMRIMRKAPKWIPAQQFGKPVRAYRKQPITFVVSNK